MMRDEQREKVLEWIKRDPVKYRYLPDFYETGAVVTQCSEEVIVLEQEDTRVTYCAGKGVETKNDRLLMVDNEEEKDRLMSTGAYQEDVLPVYMWYYPDSTVTVPCVEGVRLRKLTMNDYDYVKKHYDAPAAAQENIIENCIRRGMTGAEDENGLCGFIGVHDERAMGLLYVQEDHRHRGIAELLEKELIRQILEEGRFPYCQVIEGNQASMKLQKKLGLEMWPEKFYWIAEKEY